MGVTLPPITYAPTPNRSSRGGQRIRGIVIHETEGSYDGAVSWLRNPAASASAHIVLSEDGQRCAQLVPWSEKAWHAVNANPYTIGIELAGFTSQANNERQINRAARIAAFFMREFDIPRRKSPVGEGICRHRDLGWFGGNHGDPGGFDWDTFVRRVYDEYRRGGFRPSWGVY